MWWCQFRILKYWFFGNLRYVNIFLKKFCAVHFTNLKWCIRFFYTQPSFDSKRKFVLHLWILSSQNEKHCKISMTTFWRILQVSINMTYKFQYSRSNTCWRHNTNISYFTILDALFLMLWYRCQFSTKKHLLWLRSTMRVW